MFNVGRNNPAHPRRRSWTSSSWTRPAPCSSASASSPACSAASCSADAASGSSIAVHELGHGGRRGGAQARPGRRRTVTRVVRRARASTASRSARSRPTAARSGRSASGRSSRTSIACPGTTSTRSSRSCSARTSPSSWSSPSQGKGVNLPAPGYLEGAQELCRRYGTYFVLDEVQTGFGRTGQDVRPRALGARARHRHRLEVALRRLRPRRRLPDEQGGVRQRLRLARARRQPRLDLRSRTTWPWPPGLPRCTSWTSRAWSSAPRGSATCCSSGREPLVERYDVVRDVRGLGLIWAIEFQEPEGGSRTWRLLERAQPGIFSQLVAVPLFSEHAILIQTAGHNMNVAQGHPAADGDRGRHRVLRLRARADAAAGAEDPGGDDALRAQGRARRPEALSRRRAVTIRKLLVANRGEIALRVFRACRELGIATVAVVAPDDTGSLHARSRGRDGRGARATSTRRSTIRAAKQTGADAIHPGYGFLAESPDFAEAVEAAGLVFVGPVAGGAARRRGQARGEGDRAEAGVPVVGTGRAGGDRLPADGQGRGRRRRTRDAGRPRSPAELDEALDGRAARGQGGVRRRPRLLRALRRAAAPRRDPAARATRTGTVVSLGERECSIQRRHQKVLEESPSPRSTPSCARGWARPPSPSPGRSATAAPARRSSCSTATTSGSSS